MRRALLGLVAVGLLAACGGGQATADGTGHAIVGRQASAAPRAATADDVVNQLKAAGLPLTNVVAETADNDPNKLMGRPHQYTAVTRWDDTRDPMLALGDISAGMVEIFQTSADMRTRATYVATVTASSPLFVEYDYSSAQGQFLVRLDRNLTPDEATSYLTALTSKWPDTAAVKS